MCFKEIKDNGLFLFIFEGCCFKLNIPSYKKIKLCLNIYLRINVKASEAKGFFKERLNILTILECGKPLGSPIIIRRHKVIF